MSRRIRQGKSLIEVLVVVSLISGALAISTMTLAALFRAEVRLRRDRDQATVAARLADLWRADAHGAVACAAEKECVFTLADGRSVKYEASGSAISREVARGQTTLHRDSFRLPADAAAAFELTKAENRELAVLKVQPRDPDQPPAAAIRPVVIEAVVNLHGASRPPEEKP
jgi:hypothetical protein